MNQLLFSNDELNSLRLVVHYLMDSEQKHHEESDEDSGHIYMHTQKIEQALNTQLGGA